MKLIHNIKVSVFCKQEEDEKQIVEKLYTLFPFEIKKQLSVKTASTFFDNVIKILEVYLEKQKEINDFVGQLANNLNKDQKALILRQIDSRVDSNLNFYLRLDKNKLINENTYWVTDSGNCYHIKMCLAAFPKKKEAGKKIIELLFEQQDI